MPYSDVVGYCTLDIHWVNLKDILINFDIVLLFTELPIRDSLNLLSWQFEEDKVRFFYLVLTSFFYFKG
jgi:hypothetical protein